MTRKFVSSGAHFCAVIATMNLVLMAAIANDESVGNKTSSVTAPPPPPSQPPNSEVSGGGPPPPKTMTYEVLPSPSKLVSSSSSRVATSGPFPTSHYPITPSIQSLVRSEVFGYSVNKSVTPSPLIGGGPIRSSVNHPHHDNSTISTFSSSSSVDVLMNSSTSPFVTLNSTVLRAQYKSNALLPCNVRNSGDGVTVSWIRRKDYHLLTVGLATYSSDDRFSAIHAQSPDDWTLKIKYVQPRDAGIYECQVSTHPPSSIFVTLHVVEARAEIVGGPEKFYKAGSSVELRCDLIDGTEEPTFVFWYQGDRMINYDPTRHINVTHSKTSSMLVIHNVGRTDSGNYTCAPSNAEPASIFVHIINGENPAAMQHGSHSTTCVPCPPLWFLSFLLSLTLQTFYLRFLSRNVDHNQRRSSHNRSHPPEQRQFFRHDPRHHHNHHHNENKENNLSHNNHHYHGHCSDSDNNKSKSENHPPAIITRNDHHNPTSKLSSCHNCDVDEQRQMSMFCRRICVFR